MSTAYPLAWPIDFPRTSVPTASRFKPHTLSQAIDELKRQLEISNASDLVISSNMTLGHIPKDKGVCIYFKLRGRRYALPCDKWSKIEDNLWALAKYVESTRLQRGWGVGSMEKDYAGYVALPPPITDSTPWRDVLQVGVSATFDEVNEAYRSAALRHHPDKGGNANTMAIVNRAWREAKAYFGRA